MWVFSVVHKVGAETWTEIWEWETPTLTLDKENNEKSGSIAEPSRASIFCSDHGRGPRVESKWPAGVDFFYFLSRWRTKSKPYCLLRHVAIYFGVTAHRRAAHLICRSRLALRAGLKMMMRCHRVEPVMMRWSPVGIPLEVSSLADEVALRVARLHTSTT